VGARRYGSDSGVLLVAGISQRMVRLVRR
jgi:hypothetical protein